MEHKRPYYSRVGGCLSRMLNVIVFIGHPSESLSGRCWRNRLELPDNRYWWRLCRFVDFIWFWEADHCKVAYLEDIEYAEQRLERHHAVTPKE